MPFYRIAKEEDFQKELETFDFIPLTVRMLIQECKVVNPKVLHTYRNITGQGMQELKKYCNQYLSVIKAYEDFKKGEAIFTEY